MKFKMNEIEYEIKEVEQEELMKYRNQDEGYYYGQSHFIEQEIWLDKELNKEKKRKTLIHELTHVYIREYITSRDIEPDEEVLCDIAANSHDIIHKIVHEYFLESGIREYRNNRLKRELNYIIDK